MLLYLFIYVLGIVVTGASGSPGEDLVYGNKLHDYSFIRQPFTQAMDQSFLRCATGLGPSDSDRNTVLGGWYFNGRKLTVPQTGSDCQDNNGEVVLVRGANGRRYPGVINLYLCGTFTTTEEGVYSCIMMNSSMMEQTTRVGVYFSGRSESLDMYPIT